MLSFVGSDLKIDYVHFKSQMPLTPIVTASGNNLTSSSATGNQWYLDGVAISGATGQTYTATQNGTYTVKVTKASSGITSPSSNAIVISSFGGGSGGTGILGNSVDNSIYIYPNPNDGIFKVKSQSKISTVEIINILGTVVFSQKINADTATIDLTKESGGIYIVKVISDQGSINQKIIVNH